MINLGTLKEITDLRSVWSHEALNFTPWVAENVDLLADAVGLDITVDLNKIFSGLAGTVALTPIPVSDIYVLLIIQALLVSLIASLSGRDISLDTAKEFIFSMGGLAGVGYTLRLVAQQGAKFLNAIWPESGSAVSATVAALGTSAIGKAAITYYVDGATIEEAKKKFEESKKEK